MVLIDELSNPKKRDLINRFSKKIMKNSRRGRIIELLTFSKTEKEILEVLDKEFPPGVFVTSNKQALGGTKWDLGINAKKVMHQKF